MNEKAAWRPSWSAVLIFFIVLGPLLALGLQPGRQAAAQLISPDPSLLPVNNVGDSPSNRARDRERSLFLSPTPLGSAPLRGSSPDEPQSRSTQSQDYPAAAASGGQAESQRKPDDLIEKFGEWTLKCTHIPEPRCELGQRTQNPQTRASLLWVEIARNQTQKLGSLTIATPLGVDLASGMRVLVDRDEAMRIKYLGCIALGCLAQPNLTQRFLDQMSQGREIRVTVANADGKPAILMMPVAGFADGYIRMARFLREKN